MMINEVDLLPTSPKASNPHNIHGRCDDHKDKMNQQSLHECQQSIDEVDFIFTPSSLTSRSSSGKPFTNAHELSGHSAMTPSHTRSLNNVPKSILKTDGERKSDATHETNNGEHKLQSLLHQSLPSQQQQQHTTSDLVKNTITSTIERKLPFPFHRKRSDPTNQQTIAGKERPKFVKCASIARLFGNTYSTQPVQSSKIDPNAKSREAEGKLPTVGNSTGMKIERFRKCPENHVENGEVDNVQIANVQVKDNCDDKDLSAKAFRSISKSLGRLWRRSHSVDISTPDPEYKVLYLGNVLTGWAKGESCIEKPLATLWRNYTQNNKPDVVMRILVCPSGLKATTRQHGLTEYWSNRVTHCSSPKGYPRLFCWIYRHEGRKLKHELRCHAVLCPKESIAEQMCQTLKENLSRALSEFKRDKINRQNARLSLVNSVYENPSMPRRKILLSVGANNYRPPMERSKSAPKLMAIEEAVGEEDEENGTGEDARRSCCKVDPIFPAMTLGRRHCRRGHSMRRSRLAVHASALKKSGQTLRERIRSVSFNDFNNTIINDDDVCEIRRFHPKQLETLAERRLSDVIIHGDGVTSNESEPEVTQANAACTKSPAMEDGESDEDFNNLLMCNKYDRQSSLTGELMSYFDSKIKMKTAASLCDLSPLQYDDEVCMATNMALIGQRASISLDDLDALTDDEADQYERVHSKCNRDDKGAFYNQDSIIDCLVSASQTNEQSADESLATPNTIRNRFDDNDCFRDRSLSQLDNSFCKNNEMVTMRNASGPGIGHSASFKGTCGVPVLDSDEGSISSGCETASNMTATNGETCEKDVSSINGQEGSLITLFASKNGRPATIKRIDSQHRSSNRNKNCSGAINTDGKENISNNGNISATMNASNNEDDCDSEYSDESGFVEYQNILVGHHNAAFHATEMPNINGKNDTNNNLSVDNNDFDGGDKVPARLIINIPKNAKSILI